MMTIKEFASLCKCNAQTLRYYDRIDLLKPVKVDPWSGYRYYDQTQAIDFVKIKNLQAADFSISEIKQLLTKSDQQVFDAFQEKISQQEQKLERIRQIQQSYLTEKNDMEKLIHSLSDFILSQLTNFEGLREFGMEPEEAPRIVSLVKSSMEKWAAKAQPSAKEVSLLVSDEIIRGADQVAEKIHSFDPKNLSDTILLGGETLSEKDIFDKTQYDTIWECDGWAHVYEFLDAIPPLVNDGDYCFSLRLREDKYTEELSFPLFMLGTMLLRKGDAEVYMGCNVEKSEDGKNHFTLMRKKV